MLRFLVYRIRYLQKRLPILKVVRDCPASDAIFFGAFVEVCDDSGATRSYRIVGPDEADGKEAAISMDSPLAKALHKKGVNDDLQVRIGDVTTTLTILSISYDQKR